MKSRASEHQALLAFKIDDLRGRGRLDAETGEAAAFREISREVGKGKGKGEAGGRPICESLSEQFGFRSRALTRVQGRN